MSLHKNQVNIGLPHNKVNSDPCTEVKPISLLLTEIKSISAAHTKTKLISMFTLKPSYTRRAHKNQVSFDPHKIKPIDPHTRKKIVCCPHTKTTFISIPTLNEVNFDPYICGPHARTNSPAQKPGQFRSPHKNHANFDPPPQKTR